MTMSVVFSRLEFEDHVSSALTYLEIAGLRCNRKLNPVLKIIYNVYQYLAIFLQSYMWAAAFL